MNDNRWLFIGTDQRLSACSRIMAERGYECSHFGTDSYTEELGERITSFSPQHLVFPILQLKGKFPVEILDKEMCLYVGVTSKEWRTSFEEVGLNLHYYLQDEQFIWRNARLTAEAFVMEYYSRTKRPIAGGHFYIAGFGKVGKMVAHVVSSLGADVTIVVRSDGQLGEALAYRYDAVRLGDTLKFQDGCLVNTIPAKWLSVQDNSKLHIFDLASAPGCLIAPPAPEYYTILPGLPGKHFPVDAAMALADALDRMYRR